MKIVSGAARVAAWVGLGLALASCTDSLEADERAELATMAMSAAALPASPTNAAADDPAAATLGRLLFFDERMSADGRVACASCHDPDEGWSDPRAFSLGVDEREGDRHSMPIPASALLPFPFWDGRVDSLWAQALTAIESEAEMSFSRLEVAHFVAAEYETVYEGVFGPLPSLDGLPTAGGPGEPTWDALSAPQQESVERILANVGKALEAYERRLLCEDTRFDRWARGEVEMTAEEEAGASSFVREGCIDCHAGPGFSDGSFHNIGIGSGLAQGDLGRAGGMDLIAGNVFSGIGPYSDDPSAGAAKLASMAAEERTLGAFRTAILRGVGQRAFFGHRGHRETLRSFLDDVYDRPRLQDSAVGELDPELRGVDVDDERDMAAFLGMLDCPPVPDELGAP